MLAKREMEFMRDIEYAIAVLSLLAGCAAEPVVPSGDEQVNEQVSEQTTAPVPGEAQVSTPESSPTLVTPEPMPNNDAAYGIDQLQAAIRLKIARHWKRPPAARQGMQCTVYARLMPGGRVVATKVVRSSGSGAFDRSVLSAVRRASPLPLPTDPELFEQFREIQFVFRPEG